MKKIYLIRISLILILMASALTGCGSDGATGPAGPAGPAGTTGTDVNAAAVVALTASKAVALADGADAVTIQADVKKADGSAIADGTIVAFSVPADGGTLSAASAVTTGGHASVTVKHAPISGAKNKLVAVTAITEGSSGSKEVKFINQPASAEVSVAFNQPVTNLAALSFKMNNTAGAAFDTTAQPVTAVNSASGSLAAGSFNAAANSTTISMVNPTGFNTGTSPVVKTTMSVAQGSGLPQFSIDQGPGNITATDVNSGPTAPAVTAANMVVTVTYDTEL
jgi:hypothetical protein